MVLFWWSIMCKSHKTLYFWMQIWELWSPCAPSQWPWLTQHWPSGHRGGLTQFSHQCPASQPWFMQSSNLDLRVSQCRCKWVKDVFHVLFVLRTPHISSHLPCLQPDSLSLASVLWLEVYWPRFLREGLAEKSVTHFGFPARPSYWPNICGLELTKERTGLVPCTHYQPCTAHISRPTKNQFQGGGWNRFGLVCLCVLTLLLWVLQCNECPLFGAFDF